MSDQDDRNRWYALAAAVSAAEFAKKKARDEARRALIISTALNENMSSDPRTQEELRRLLEAETRRVRQENFQWALGWWVLGIVVGGPILLLLFAGIASSSSYQSTAYVAATPAPSAYVAETPTPAPSPTPYPTPRPTPHPTPGQPRSVRLHPGKHVQWQGGATGEVTGSTDQVTAIRWQNARAFETYTNEQIAKFINTHQMVIQ